MLHAASTDVYRFGKRSQSLCLKVSDLYRPEEAMLKKRAYSKAKKRRGKHKRKKNIKKLSPPSYRAVNTEESVDINGLMLDMSQLTEGFVI